MAVDKTEITPEEATPEPTAATPPQVIVQMIQPIANEPTQGLSEIKSGGKYLVDGVTVDAHGKEI